MGDDSVQHLPVFRHTQSAVPIFDNAVRTSRIKAGYDSPVPASSNGELCLIAVMKHLLRPDDGFHGNLCKSANPLKVSPHLSLLKSKLLLIGQCLQLTATAGRRKCACRFHAVRGSHQHFHQPSVAIILFCLEDLCLHSVADDCVFYKNGEAIHLADTSPACGWRPNIKFIELTLVPVICIPPVSYTHLVSAE